MDLSDTAMARSVVGVVRLRLGRFLRRIKRALKVRSADQWQGAGRREDYRHDEAQPVPAQFPEAVASPLHAFGTTLDLGGFGRLDQPGLDPQSDVPADEF